MIAFMIAFMIDAGLAILPASIAQRKGKSFGAWYVYGLFLWFIAIIHAFSLPEISLNNSDNLNISTNNTNAVNKKLVTAYPTNRCQYEASTNDNSTQYTAYSAIDLSCLLEIVSFLIYRDTSGNAILTVLIRNLYSVNISAIKLEIAGFNAFNELVYINGASTFIYNLQYLVMQPGLDLESERIILPDNTIQKVKVVVRKILFESGDILLNERPRIVDISPQAIEPDEDQVLAHCIFRDRLDDKDASNEGNMYRNLFLAKECDQLSYTLYYPEQHEHFWVCTCGRANGNELSYCARCHIYKHITMDMFSKQGLAIEHDRQMIHIRTTEAEKKLEESRHVFNQRKEALLKKTSQRYFPLFLAVPITFAIITAVSLMYRGNHEMIEDGNSTQKSIVSAPINSQHLWYTKATPLEDGSKQHKTTASLYEMADLDESEMARITSNTDIYLLVYNEEYRADLSDFLMEYQSYIMELKLHLENYSNSGYFSDGFLKCVTNLNQVCDKIIAMNPGDELAEFHSIFLCTAANTKLACIEFKNSYLNIPDESIEKSIRYFEKAIVALNVFISYVDKQGVISISLVILSAGLIV